MQIEVIVAWPDRFQSVMLELNETATVQDALTASGFSNIEGITGYAIYGQTASLDTTLCMGDRVELLRPLMADPKDARRKRAKVQKAG